MPANKYISVRIKSMFPDDLNFRFTSEVGNPPTTCPVQRLFSNEDFQDVIVGGEIDTYYQFPTGSVNGNSFYFSMAPYIYCADLPCYQEIEIAGICDNICPHPTVCVGNGCVCPVGVCDDSICSNNCSANEQCYNGFCKEVVISDENNNKVSLIGDGKTPVEAYVGVGVLIIFTLFVMFKYIKSRKTVGESENKSRTYVKSMTL
jgi:hypothetical protein